MALLQLMPTDHVAFGISEPDMMENLYPALLECFVVIMCGFVAGRMNLISENESKGLNTFVGTFALPSLIFLSLAELDLSSVNWLFLSSILIAKGLLFIAVIILTLLVGRPLHLGRAGLFAIFCTQSNDFAIGYPIVVVLYRDTHPEYASYLYLMAPISLIILNPIGFLLMEISKRKEKKLESQNSLENNENSRPATTTNSQLRAIYSVAKGIFLNPVILMTMLGIFGNFIFHHHLPQFAVGILNVLGSSFSATALFLLGLRMVGKMHKLQGSALVLPGILIIAKLLVLPLITREVVSLLHVGMNATDTLDLSTYGFLYGTFPAAPGVFVFATQYSLDIDLIATSMVACTFLSAPLMFVSAKMISLSKMNPLHYLEELDAFVFDISIVSIVLCAWLFILFILSKKYRRLPHRIACCMIVSQIISAVGTILWSTLDRSSKFKIYVQFFIITLGMYSSRLWTAFLAITLLFMQCRSICFALKIQPIFIIIGWGVPIILATLLLIFDEDNVLLPEKQNPIYQYGLAQAATALFLLIICFIVTVGCLVFHQRYTRRRARYLSLSNEIATPIAVDNDISNCINDSTINTTIQNDQDFCALNQSGCDGLRNDGTCCSRDTENGPRVVDIEDLIGNNLAVNYNQLHSDESVETDLCSNQYNCSEASRAACQQDVVQRYSDHAGEGLEPIEIEEFSDDPQVLRHIVLLIFQLCSMFVGIAVTFWTLVMEDTSGIYVELSFLDVTLNYGQSLIIFAIFGLDTKEIILPVLKSWRILWYGANILSLPTLEELNQETKLVCDQFVTHHIATCNSALARDKRWRIKVYKNVFKGTVFVDWLIQVGLAHDRVDAINYGRRLIDGRVMRHINNVHHFYDRPLLYTLEK